MKVLVAEDDPVSRRILEKLLTNQGCTTTICNDGRQAWEVYQEGDYRLIISDWMMPEIDGLELVRRILDLQRDIQILRGTLPICAWCKRIRDDDRLWHSVEEYLSSHTEADFSHSICPQC